METSLPTATTTGTVIPTNTFSYSVNDADVILGHADGDPTFLHTPSLTDLQRQYTNETKRVTALNLHLTTLKEYYKSQRIPRGLRFQPRENAYSQDIEYRTKFELITNKYSFDLMLLNMEFLYKDLMDTQTRIATIETSLHTTCKEEDITNLMEKQTNFLQKFKTDQETVKRNKWHRDNFDYTTGRVYTWGASSSQKRFRKTKDSNTDSNDTQKRDTTVDNNNIDFLGVTSGPKEDPHGEGAAAMDAPVKTRAQRNPKTAQAKLSFKKK
ncbi:uncharacterized protein LOC130368307 [Hyla sarda]|uniref:uncharacterized protein LOC130368307 n=1 Tax=Hyla sarda TaxID=327740 RepID=UPI0024C31520|nr:uncharacterized protein LOC130368307 [Hyla sarda]